MPLITLYFLLCEHSCSCILNRVGGRTSLPRHSSWCPCRTSLRCVIFFQQSITASSLTFPNFEVTNFLYFKTKGMVGLSLGETHFIQGGIAQDLRCDGRKRLTYRPISVETGVIPQTNGSARVRMGATDVIASVKAELGKPSLLQPDKGKVSIYVDCSSTAEPAFEGRGGDELAAELSNALQRCLLGGKSGAGIPRVQVAAGTSNDEHPEVDVSDEEFLQFDTSRVPVIVTLTKVGRHYIVDATSEEESQMSSAVSISVNRQGHICGITKRGGVGLDPSIILDMISVAKHVSEQLINKLDSEIASAEAEEES
ncbi:Exosome complex component RRP42 [Glycine max]|nr:Exosome complex component RRP42 [Glycine max]